MPFSTVATVTCTAGSRTVRSPEPERSLTTNRIERMAPATAITTLKGDRAPRRRPPPVWNPSIHTACAAASSFSAGTATKAAPLLAQVEDCLRLILPMRASRRVVSTKPASTSPRSTRVERASAIAFDNALDGTCGGGFRCVSRLVNERSTHYRVSHVALSSRRRNTVRMVGSLSFRLTCLRTAKAVISP